MNHPHGLDCEEVDEQVRDLQTEIQYLNLRIDKMIGLLREALPSVQERAILTGDKLTAEMKRDLLARIRAVPGVVGGVGKDV